MTKRVFGERSKRNLEGVHPTLVKIAERALQISKTDFTVICGYRDKAGQDAALKAKTTKVSFPNSAHNQSKNGKPRSVAIDVIPFPFSDWNDPSMLKGWREIAEAMFLAAEEVGVLLRHGGDFNRDGNKTTNDAWDKPHFELHPWRSYARS